ncbi:hypothetical protein JB92DRAFT_2920445 [Gautieria morchelliformis]|nr:hypothetical protein JB92DRAFT_2920445 [Gautieria morchelliformis]
MSSPAPRWPTPPPIYEHPVTLTTSLKPYLTLPYLLSLTWLAYPILSLLFVAFRLQLSLASAENAVSDAKNNLLASCKAAEQAATSAASLPRYMAVGTNKQIVDAVNSTMNGAREALILSLTVMEAIINFIIDTYRSTFLCFVELVVRGGLDILISAVQELQQFIQNSLSSIRTSIQNDVAGANSAIASAVNGINKILPFGANIKVPQFSIPSLNALNNVTLPTDFENALISLNSSIPSLDALRNQITDFVDTPFELVKKDINDTFLGFSFNESVLPVPQINTVSFCGQLDTGVVDDLGSALIKVAQIGTIILIVLALLLLAGHCLLEWYKWRCLRQSLERTRLAWSTDPTVYHVTAVTSTPSLHMTDHNLLTLHATSTHPLLARLANKIAAVCHLTPSQFVHLQFFFHYVFHPPALACFLIGFFGLLSVELQLLALGPVQAKFSQQVSTSVSSFSNTIADSMNASMQNQSAVYADSINGQVSTMQASINNGLFGWVNGTTSTLNGTLNTFYTEVQNTVTALLGGTILDQPAQEFVRCIIGTKVQALENALTFLHDNLNVNLPVINQTVLLLSPAQVNEAAQPISQAAVGSNGSNGGIVGSVVNRYVNDLKKERIMFGIFMGLWGVVVFMALCIIFWHSYGKVWLQAHKRKRWQRAQHRDVDTVVRAWTHDNGSNNSAPPQLTNEKEKVLHSFGPMASPVKTGFFAALRKAAAEANGQRSMERTISNPTSESSSHDTSSWERPSMLMAVGRKAMGREVLVPDNDPEAQSRGTYSDKTEVFEVEIKEEKGMPWWRRLWKRRASIDSFESGEKPKVPAFPMAERRHPPPNLTIETNIVPPQSQRDRYPIIVQDEPEVEQAGHEPLVSAWSISPASAPTPWARPPANTLPLRLKPRPSAALPQSVDSSYGPSLTLSNATPFKGLPPPPGSSVPIHHAFVRPIPHGTPSSPSPPASPVLDSWAPPSVNGRYTNHARTSSMAMVDNPFATCFDDEHRVQLDPPAKTANPFADGASGTPRAV